MTPDEWRERFREASAELEYLAMGGVPTGDDVTERKGELLDALDELEFIGGAKYRSGEW